MFLLASCSNSNEPVNKYGLKEMAVTVYYLTEPVDAEVLKDAVKTIDGVMAVSYKPDQKQFGVSYAWDETNNENIAAAARKKLGVEIIPVEKVSTAGKKALCPVHDTKWWTQWLPF